MLSNHNACSVIGAPLGEFGVSRTRILSLKRLGIENIYDLLTYFPVKITPSPYFVRSGKKLYQMLMAGKELPKDFKVRKTLITAEIYSIKLSEASGKWNVSRLEIKLKDEHNFNFEVVYFAKSLRYLEWLQSKYDLKDKVIIVGVPQIRVQKLQFSHPEMKVYQTVRRDFLKRDFNSIKEGFAFYGRPRVKYKATKGLKSDCIAQLIRNAIAKLETHGNVSVRDPWAEKINDTQDEIFPDVIEFQSRWKAIKSVHQPKTLTEYENAVVQLKFEEAYILQTLLGLKKANIHAKTAIPRKAIANGYLTKFDATLPFELTPSQRRVGNVLRRELGKSAPMQRLLQGDVGSGKTLVALRAMLQVVDAGAQAVLLAPTEVLASQHFASVSTILQNSAPEVEVRLLTGKLKTSEKRRTEAEIASGKANIIVGTQALLFRHEIFNDLGLIVIDEQHRFGVEQRDKLRDQPKNVPHLLVMTATPIPRSVAMMLFADLEISTLKDMPKGRGEQKTLVIEADNKQNMHRMWEQICNEIGKGRNVFLVAPRIDDKDLLETNEYTVNTGQNNAKFGEDYENDEDDEEITQSPVIATEIYQKLQSAGLDEMLTKSSQSVEKLVTEVTKNQSLGHTNFGILHGRMSRDQKAQIMQDFTDLKIPLLISTTVIEVGIDVPNATVIAIFDADKFGMSALHQLRGRVGRGKYPSTCYLVTSKGGASEIGRGRIETIAKFQDGFKIANSDLKMRGEGDILGSKQSGVRSSLKLLRVAKDAQIITKACKLAQETLANDPRLEHHLGLNIAVNRELSGEAKSFLTKN